MSSTERPIYASDTQAWDHCKRLAWFLFHPPSSEKIDADPFAELIKNLGRDHEADILRSFSTHEEAVSVTQTQALIEQQTPVIYQAKFHDRENNIAGTPDFLVLTDQGYQIADAKLALSVENNRAILAQLGVYEYLLSNEENSDANALAKPQPLVYLGDGEAYEVEIDTNALASEFLADMGKLRAQPDQPEVPFSYSKCHACAYIAWCMDGFEAADELTLSPAVDARTAKQLKLQQLNTLSALAAARPEDIQEAPYLRNPDKRLRIVQQARSLRSGEIIQREPAAWPSGTLVHFDVESDPMGASGGGEVYLWGLLKPPYDSQAFESVWKETDDFGAWQDFLRLMQSYRERWEDLVLVHYSPYERVVLQQYAARYQAQEDETVRWLLDEQGPLWDLQAFVKRYFVLPVLSYGLKSICRDERLVNFQWRLAESGSQWSVVRYYDYVAALAAGNASLARGIRAEILTYNEDDVRATAAMVDWLNALDG